MLESQATPTNEDSTVPPTTPDEDSGDKSRQDKIDEVAALLAGDDEKPDGDKPDGDKSPAQDEDSQKAGKQYETLDAVAEALDVDVSALYDIAIKQAPGPDGEDRTVKLGELADLAKDKGQFELDRIELAETKRKQEAKFMRAQQQINELVSMLPKSAISKDLVEAVANRMAETQERERGLTLDVIPEWQDEQVEKTERQAIQKSLSEYGFSDGYLDTVHDHRTLKYIRDNWQRQQRMERALAAMRKKTPSSQRPSKPAGPHKGADTKPARPGKGPKGQAQKVAAVAELLRTSED
jgi:hypothetical protein